MILLCLECAFDLMYFFMTFSLVVATSMKTKVGPGPSVSLAVEIFNSGMPLILLGGRLRKTHALMVQSVVLGPSPVPILGGVLGDADVQYATAQDLHWSRGVTRSRSRSTTVKLFEVQPKREPSILPDRHSVTGSKLGVIRIIDKTSSR